MEIRTEHYIGGRWIPGTGEAFVAFDRAHLEEFASFRAAEAAQVDAAVAAARHALPSWADLSQDERAAFLLRYAGFLEENKQEVSLIISRETGKPLSESRAEVELMRNKVDLSQRAVTERLAAREVSPGSELDYRPIGVAAVFGPFNMPGHLPGSHFVPALLAGNTVVFKPSELTPAVGSMLGRGMEEAGLPAGVFNLVQGARSTGVLLSQSPGIDGLFFTGSSATGEILARQFAPHVERLLALELGGNNPLVVHGVANRTVAVRATIHSAFVTAGQRCTCARRLILPRGEEGDRFLEELCETTARIRVGHYDEKPEPFLGPVVSQSAAAAVLRAQSNLVAAGGRILVECRTKREHPLLLSPGILDTTGVDDPPDEEVFGPFLQVRRVADFAAAVEEANRTAFGLSAALFSDDRNLWNEFRRRVRAGVVNWNRPTTGASGALPFGGLGRSGNFRPGGFFAVDYCAAPVAHMVKDALSDSELPAVPLV